MLLQIGIKSKDAVVCENLNDRDCSVSLRELCPTSLRFIQVKVEVVFELLLFGPVNRLLLFALLGQSFLFSTRFCQSVGLVAW